MTSEDTRERLGDGLMIAGAAALLLSLFLSWSHQFSPAFLAEFGSSVLLNGVPRNPTAWQVFTSVDVLLALLAGALVLTALVGQRSARMVVLAAVGVALAFTLHAIGDPPTKGANIFNPAAGVPAYTSTGATAGPGETLALVGLGAAIAGLGLGFTVA
jgi:hypothetical protein